MKKGFVLAETIIVIAFLTAALLSIYSIFSNVLLNEEERMMYDDVTYIYRTKYILDIFEQTRLYRHAIATLDDIYETEPDNKSTLDLITTGEVIEGTENLTLLTKINCHTFNDPAPSINLICTELVEKDTLNVENIYITHTNTLPLTECIGNGDNCELHPSLVGLSNNAINYLKSLNSTEDPSLKSKKHEYYIVVEYKVTENNQTKYYYSSLQIIPDLDEFKIT